MNVFCYGYKEENNYKEKNAREEKLVNDFHRKWELFMKFHLFISISNVGKTKYENKNRTIKVFPLLSPSMQTLYFFFLISHMSFINSNPYGKWYGNNITGHGRW